MIGEDVMNILYLQWVEVTPQLHKFPGELLSPFKPSELDSTDVAPSSIGGDSHENIECSRSSVDGIPDDPDEDKDKSALHELP